MTPEDLIARVNEVAQQLNTIYSDFDNVQFKTKEELTVIQRRLREIGAIRYNFWTRVIDRRMKM